MRINSVEMLAPGMKNRIIQLMHELGEWWTIFETYRSPADQYQAHIKGTTKVGPWHSAHQYGLAADIVPLNAARKPYWPEVGDPLWQHLHDTVGHIEGLQCPIVWDPGHIEWDLWPEIHSEVQ